MQAALIAALLFGCRAQVRNGDRIQADPYLEYSAELRALVPMEAADPDDRITGIGEDSAEPGEAAESDKSAEPAPAPIYAPAPEKVLDTLAGADGIAARNDRGVARAKLLDLDLAEAEFRGAMQGGGSVLPFTNLARLYVLIGENERARNVYGEMTASNAAAADDLYARALNYEHQRRLTEATLIMEALVNRKLRTIDSALWLAATAMRSNDYGRASNYYDAVLAADPKNARGLFGRGYISYLAQDYENAALFLGLAHANGSAEPQLPYFLTHALFQEQEYRSGDRRGAEHEGSFAGPGVPARPVAAHPRLSRRSRGLAPAGTGRRRPGDAAQGLVRRRRFTRATRTAKRVRIALLMGCAAAPRPRNSCFIMSK